jgi:hypothetical protein
MKFFPDPILNKLPRLLLAYLVGHAVRTLDDGGEDALGIVPALLIDV